MPQKLYPSAHILEMFMPYLHDEKRLIEVLRKIAEMDFYRNVELPTFPTKEYRDTVRRILRDNDLSAATYAAPYLNEREMSLCDLNDRRRAETIRFLKMQADLAAECGYSTFGVPSGPYPGDEFHDEAMAVQADTLARIADYTALLGMNCSIEPLDRYVHKKALIGPMDEVVRWFKPLHKAHPNLFLHWDSSHEQLGGLGIFNTLEMAAPYMSQIHLCDCIDDPAHPCFGDLHMDPAEAPDWKTEGFLTPAVGAEIIRRAAAFDKPEGVRRFWVSVEVLGHKGDNLWHKERIAREFLTRCWEESGVEMSR
ncbi:MAG: sugar phosphate isomerase/epimerase [Oscillospiraceae bacterium]|nr:sugar phosphate isomerase/epimerase [Oscillospiraceae bacterium]